MTVCDRFSFCVYIRFIGTHKEYDQIDCSEEHYALGEPTLVDVLKLRMYEMGLNQKSLSKLIGVSPSRLSDYISGKCEPTLKVAREINRKLNIDANIILGV